MGLDILEYMPRLTPQGQIDRLREQMQSASYFKGVEEEGSRKRMAELMAIEEERQRELSRRQTAQRRSERRTLLIFLAGAAVVLILLALFVLLN